MDDDSISISRLDRQFKALWTTKIAWEDDFGDWSSNIIVMGDNIAYTRMEYTYNYDSAQIICTLHDIGTGDIVRSEILAKDTRQAHAGQLIPGYRRLLSNNGSSIAIYQTEDNDKRSPDTLHTYVYAQDLTLIGERLIISGSGMKRSPDHQTILKPDDYGNIYKIYYIRPATIAVSRHNHLDGTSKTLYADIRDFDLDINDPWTLQFSIDFLAEDRINIALAKEARVNSIFTRSNRLSGVSVMTYDFGRDTAYEAFSFPITDSLALRLVNDDIIPSVILQNYWQLDSVDSGGHLFLFELAFAMRPGRVTYSDPTRVPLSMVYYRFWVIALAFDSAGNPLWQRALRKEQHSNSEQAIISFSAHYDRDHISLIYSAEKDETVVRANFPLNESSPIRRDRILDLSGGALHLYPHSTIWLSDTEAILVTNDKYYNDYTLKRISIPLSK